LDLRWNPAAVVDEHIPPERMTLDDMRERRIRHGQNRVANVVAAGGGGGKALGAAWILAGAIQYAFFKLQAIVLRLIGSPKYRAAMVKSGGGWGKMMWRAHNKHKIYGD
jgi:hypothetical protein